MHSIDCVLGKVYTYRYVFSSMSLSLSCNCFHDVAHQVLSNTLPVNHHQTSFDIAFALTDCDILHIHVHILSIDKFKNILLLSSFKV